MKSETERLTVDAPDAFRALGISKNAGYSLIQRGQFPCKVIKAGKRLLIPKAALTALLGEAAGGEKLFQPENKEGQPSG
jgi:hypothetical protein